LRVAEIPPQVLVVRLGAIGDVVNALVFATALKEHRPSTAIGWVVHDLARPLVEDHPSVDRVHVWRRGTGLAGLGGLVRELRRARYGLAVDLQRIAKSALVARLSGAPRVLGFDRARAKESSWLLASERIPPGDPAAHMVEQYMEFARHLGVDAAPRRRLPRDAGAEAWADALVDALGAAPVQIGLGATKPANRWEPERFGRLAARLARERDVPVCLTGGPADGAAAARALRAAGGEAGVTRLVGETTLRQLCALSARARLFVGCDTGPMHVAAALETPVVALFGPADPRRTGPYGAGHRVVRVPPACAPCNRRTCNQPRHACMEDITVELVLGAAREALGGVPAACRPRRDTQNTK
jgi:lipopolysaccharide heptosyltransferase II